MLHSWTGSEHGLVHEGPKRGCVAPYASLGGGGGGAVNSIYGTREISQISVAPSVSIPNRYPL